MPESPSSESLDVLKEVIHDATSTPQMRERALEATIEIKEKRIDAKNSKPRVWKSCCLELDKDFAIYFTQMGILSSIIAFSAVMLSKSDTCEDTNTFIGLLTMCIGIIIPNPKMT